jgi:hypothetical protein
LVGLRAQASLYRINSQKDRLFCIDRATWDTKLHSTAADDVPPPQVKRGAVLSSTRQSRKREGLQTAMTPQTMREEQQAVRCAEQAARSKDARTQG